MLLVAVGTLAAPSKSMAAALCCNLARELFCSSRLQAIASIFPSATHDTINSMPIIRKMSLNFRNEFPTTGQRGSCSDPFFNLCIVLSFNASNSYKHSRRPSQTSFYYPLMSLWSPPGWSADTVPPESGHHYNREATGQKGVSFYLGRIHRLIFS